MIKIYDIILSEPAYFFSFLELYVPIINTFLTHSLSNFKFRMNLTKQTSNESKHSLIHQYLNVQRTTFLA